MPPILLAESQFWMVKSFFQSSLQRHSLSVTKLQVTSLGFGHYPDIESIDYSNRQRKKGKQTAKPMNRVVCNVNLFSLHMFFIVFWYIL